MIVKKSPTPFPLPREGEQYRKRCNLSPAKLQKSAKKSKYYAAKVQVFNVKGLFMPSPYYTSILNVVPLPTSDRNTYMLPE